MSFRLSALHLFPIKSCAPLNLDHADVEPRGLVHDRRWMVVDEHAKFVTGREVAGITLLRAVPLDAIGTLRLDAPGMPAFLLAPPTGGVRKAVTVWSSTVDALPAGVAANRWISTFLQRPAELVYMDDAAVRSIDPKYAQPHDVVSFADAYPLLLISQAALDQLNGKLAAPVPMLRFRPNLVVSGTEPHAEDEWKRVRIGEIEFDLVKLCTRCVFTTVDFERGERDPSGEPLRTLITYRRSPNGVTFGQNLIPRGTGILRVGDRVEVLA
jgi:uncharacterized protein YcbX